MRLGQIIAFYREYAAIITNVSILSDSAENLAVQGEDE